MKRRILFSLVALAGLVVPMLASAAPAFAQVYGTHRVQPGETLAKIARRYCGTWQELYAINRDSIGASPDNIVPGMMLTVVNHCTAGHLPELPSGIVDRGPRTHAAGSFRSPYYTTAWGDTLFSIGQRFGVTVDRLRQANGLSGNTIRAGMALLIPGAGAVQPPAAPTPERVYFGYGNISATRTGIISNGVPKSYILGGQAGQVMEIGTKSHGEALVVSVRLVGGQMLGLGGENNKVMNNLYVRLPSTGDYVVTMTPASLPESPYLAFDVTFIIQ